jgi:excisionase family DNA binding protein
MASKAKSVKASKRMLPADEENASVEDVSELFHVSIPTVWRWIAEDRIKSFKIGRRRLFNWGYLKSISNPATASSGSR